MTQPTFRQRLGNWIAGPKQEKEFSGLSAYLNPWEVSSGIDVPVNSTDYINAFMNRAWVYIAVNIIADAIASVPLVIYRDIIVEGEVKPQIVDQGPLVDLLWRPNPAYSLEDLLKVIYQGLGTCGNAYLAIEPGTAELWPLLPDKVTIYPDVKGFIKKYEYKPNTKPKDYDPTQIIHFRLPSTHDLYYGLSPMAAAVQAIVTDTYAQNYNKEFFNRGCSTTGVLETEKKISQDTADRIQAEWRKKYGLKKGKDGHGIPILHSGLKYNPTTASPKDMEFLGLRKMNREEILGCYRVPPAKAGIYEYANYANADAQERFFMRDGVIPNLKIIQATFNRSALFANSKKLYCKFDLSDIQALKEDEQIKANTARTLVDGRIMTPNEVRAKFFDMPPLTEEQLEDFPKPPTTFNWGQEPNGDQEQEPEPEQEQEQEQEQAPEKQVIIKAVDSEVIVYSEKELVKLNQHLARVGKNENSLIKLLKKHFADQRARVIDNLKDDLKAYGLGCKTVDDTRINGIVLNLNEEVEKILEILGPQVREMVNQGGKDSLRELLQSGFIAQIGADFNLNNPYVQEFIQTKIRKTAYLVEATTEQDLRDQLARGMEAGESVQDLQKRVKKVFGYRSDSDALMIARTEANSAANYGTLAAHQQADVEYHGWLSAEDGATRPSHYFRQTVRVGDYFKTNDGTPLKFPGDPDGPPGEIINCRCTLIPMEGPEK